MSGEKFRENWEIWGIAIVVSGAVLAGLVFRGVTGDSLSDAVKDIGAALIPIVTAFLAARLVIREMDPAQRFQRAGEEALKRISSKHPDWLDGPKPNKVDYDSENPGKAGRYLFFQKRGTKERAQFVPIIPLGDGVVQIRVPKQGVVVLGLAKRGETEHQEEALKHLKGEIQRAVQAVIDKRWSGFLDETEDTEKPKDPYIAIQVDFNESKLGPRKFAQAVEDCVEAARQAIEATLKKG